MKKIFLGLIALLLASNLKAEVGGKYIFIKSITKYMENINKNKKDTIMDLAYTLWQESRGGAKSSMLLRYRWTASVVVNRANLLNKKYAIYKVIHAKKQFSCWGRDGKTQTHKVSSDYEAFLLALKVASKYVDGSFDVVTNATLYHANNIKPNWNYSKIKKVKVYGGHTYYVKK